MKSELLEILILKILTTDELKAVAQNQFQPEAFVVFMITYF